MLRGGVEATTGRKLLSLCDVRRLQCLRDGDHENDLKLVLVPPALHYTLSDEYYLKDPRDWRRLQETVQKIRLKASGRFILHNEHFQNAAKAIDCAKLALAGAIKTFHDRNFDQLSLLLNKDCGDKEKTDLHKDAVEALKKSLPSVNDIGLQTLCALGDPVLKDYEIARANADADLDVLFSVARGLSDSAVPFDELQRRLIKFTEFNESKQSFVEFPHFWKTVAAAVYTRVTTGQDLNDPRATNTQIATVGPHQMVCGTRVVFLYVGCA